MHYLFSLKMLTLKITVEEQRGLRVIITVTTIHIPKYIATSNPTHYLFSLKNWTLKITVAEQRGIRVTITPT